MRRNRTFSIHLCILGLLLFSGCANLHAVMIGERRLPPAGGQAFDTKVNETGFDVKEATDIAGAIGGKNSGLGKAGRTVNNLYSLVSFGPTTGNHVLNAEYADAIGEQSQNACAPEKTIGVVSVRETMKYPVLSGEIVKVEGLCK